LFKTAGAPFFLLAGSGMEVFDAAGRFIVVPQSQYFLQSTGPDFGYNDFYVVFGYEMVNNPASRSRQSQDYIGPFIDQPGKILIPA